MAFKHSDYRTLLGHCSFFNACSAKQIFCQFFLFLSVPYATVLHPPFEISVPNDEPSMFLNCTHDVTPFNAACIYLVDTTYNSFPCCRQLCLKTQQWSLPVALFPKKGANKCHPLPFLQYSPLTEFCIQ